MDQQTWTRNRLEALDKIEIKLREMRELAVYAAGRVLSEDEAAEVQEWVDILKAEVDALDRSTASGNPIFSNLTLWHKGDKLPPH